MLMRFLCFFLFIQTLCCLGTPRHMVENPLSPWGVDQDLTQVSRPKPLSKTTLSKASCEKMIRFFQVHISPIDGPRSHFYPTSSQYALDAIKKYGALQGIAMGCDRLMRENADPWFYPVTENYGIARKVDRVR